MGRVYVEATGVSVPAITIDLPQDAFSAIRRLPQEFAQEMRLAAALFWYSHGEI